MMTDHDVEISPLHVIQTGQTEQSWEEGGLPRIAIIGAGAGGERAPSFTPSFSPPPHFVLTR